MSITAYIFAKDLSLDCLKNLAEEVPDGLSTQELICISREFGIPILAGLFEKDEGKLFNSYICVNREGLVAKHI